MAARYPCGAIGAAPGVATTIDGRSSISRTMRSAELERTGIPGNARPNSSAVRTAPIAVARSAVPLHCEHDQSSLSCPHMRHIGLLERLV